MEIGKIITALMGFTFWISLFTMSYVWFGPKVGTLVLLGTLYMNGLIVINRDELANKILTRLM